MNIYADICGWRKITEQNFWALHAVGWKKFRFSREALSFPRREGPGWLGE